ncbi:MAG: class I SAM-dependent methyltransferase [Mesorhizobium sp.]|nr:MAG: class I SAM-dependent methyltransferase [Mesorhizobium sp.]
MVKASDSKPVAVDAYASFAKRYDALAPTQPHNALYERPASFELLGETAGLDILDAGCGSGICSEKLARSGARVSVFDITPEMLGLARERCAGLDVDIRLGDLEKPLDCLADGSFDRIICSLALDYVERLTPVWWVPINEVDCKAEFVREKVTRRFDVGDEQLRGGGTQNGAGCGLSALSGHGMGS